MRTAKAVLLIPADSSYTRVRDVVECALRDAVIEPLPLRDTFQVGAQWANMVTDAIQEADLVVADISQKNPNVLYELGFAYALRKPTLLLLSTDSTNEVPSDLAGYQMVTYDPKNLRSLQSQMSRTLSSYVERWRVAS